MSRLFKLSTILFILGFCFIAVVSEAKVKTPIVLKSPKRIAGQQSVIGLTAPKLDTVRIGFIGLGQRGTGAIKRYINIEGVKIVALCDIRASKVENAQQILKKAGLPQAVSYSGNEDVWKKLCERGDIDLIYICTDWKMHTPMAVYAMEHGKHVACEVPIATTVDECWQLVNTSEKTRKHCMMLENCCYDFIELTALNMAQKGVFGEIVHAEGAYIHDLRSLNFETNDNKGYYDMWRLKYNEIHTGNQYATHGIGPIAQVLNIGRGDRMDFLVSLSSNQFGMTQYAKEKFGKNSTFAKTPYANGDMNTTLIKTANGKSIMIQHDVTNPRPYNRKYALSGTKGYFEKYPTPALALDSNTDLIVKFDNLGAHKFLPKEEFDTIMSAYEHPMIKEYGEKAKKVGGHGGMDFIMDSRLIYCLRNGLPLDMNVYDAADWSCFGELTEISVKNNSSPIAFPDFTRGEWKKTNGFKPAYK